MTSSSEMEGVRRAGSVQMLPTPPQPPGCNFVLIAHHLEPRDGAGVYRLRKSRERGFICGYREAIIHVG